MAYVAQRPWFHGSRVTKQREKPSVLRLLNGTLLENLLFGMPEDAQKLEETLESCALLQDWLVSDLGPSNWWRDASLAANLLRINIIPGTWTKSFHVSPVLWFSLFCLFPACPREKNHTISCTHEGRQLLFTFEHLQLLGIWQIFPLEPFNDTGIGMLQSFLTVHQLNPWATHTSTILSQPPKKSWGTKTYFIVHVCSWLLFLGVVILTSQVSVFRAPGLGGPAVGPCHPGGRGGRPAVRRSEATPGAGAGRLQRSAGGDGALTSTRFWFGFWLGCGCWRMNKQKTWSNFRIRCCYTLSFCIVFEDTSVLLFWALSIFNFVLGCGCGCGVGCLSSLQVVLMDDVLSALDAHVGKHVFEKVICQQLAGRTRILVTHQVQYWSHPAVTRTIFDFGYALVTFVWSDWSYFMRFWLQLKYRWSLMFGFGPATFDDKLSHPIPAFLLGAVRQELNTFGEFWC